MRNTEHNADTSLEKNVSCGDSTRTRLFEESHDNRFTNHPSATDDRGGHDTASGALPRFELVHGIDGQVKPGRTPGAEMHPINYFPPIYRPEEGQVKPDRTPGAEINTHSYVHLEPYQKETAV